MTQYAIKVPLSVGVKLKVASLVVARSLAHGGQFAELYAERRGGLAMSIDESRIEGV